VTGPRLALVLCFLCLFPAAQAAPAWAHERSDLAPDPAVHWGVLPNGLRYALRPNAEPKGRVSLRFIVKVGSMEEQDDERGLAHFIEHMAFRSTRGHPGGSLVSALQRLGIAFGPDNTAFTTYDYTIYHLELPDDRTETLREALNVFRSYADGILFKPEEIEPERGVVLSEMATRNTPDARGYQANLDFIMPQARQTQRAPIGLEDQIRHFTPAQFHAFYDAWYRPERMILAVVGTIDPATVEPLISEILGPVQDRAPARPEPDPLLPPVDDHQGMVRIFTDPGIVGIGLSLEHAVPDPEAPETRARRTRELHTALAFNMLQQRLNKMALQRDTSFIAPQVNVSTNLQGWRVSSLSFPSKQLAWRLLTSDAEQALRRARTYGFTASELAEAKKAFRTYYEQGARSAATTPSDSLATQLAVSIANDNVFSSPGIIWQEMQPLLNEATLADCLAAFKNTWGDDPPKLFISANSTFTIGERTVAAAYAYSQRVEVLPPVEHGIPAFAYTDFGPPGELQHREHLDDFDAWLTAFKNGVRFNFKHTDFEADTVVINLRVGNGLLSQPAGQPGLNLLANYGFLSGGLGRQTNAELSDILNGHVIGLSFAVEPDALAFSVRCAPRELLLGLQMLTAILTDAGYRPEAMRSARAGFGSLFASLGSSPGGPIFMTAPVALANGDQRFGIPSMAVLSQRNLTELRRWLDPQLKQGAIEVSVVGDIGFAAAEQAMAQTLGALPPRPAATVEVSPVVAVALPPAAPVVQVIDPKLNQCAVGFYWPVRDLKFNVHEERRCRLLASIMEERLRQRVREELGATYALSATFMQFEGFPLLNYFAVYAEVEPTRGAEVDEIIRREMAAMQREGITRDEFDRAKQPFVAERSADLRSNAYWGYTVLRDAQQKPLRLAAARDRTADTAGITQAEVQALIDRYLTPAAAFVFRTVPAR
jgi:zinc protease